MTPRIVWFIFFGVFIFDLFSVKFPSNSLVESKPQFSSELNQPSVDDIKPIKTKKTKKIKKEIIEENDNDDDEFEDKIPKKKIKSVNDEIQLHIQICQSWSHKGYFNQIKQYFESRYRNIIVIPEEYPLSPMRKMLSYLLTFIQMSTIVIIISSQFLKPYLTGFLSIQTLDWIEENKMTIGFGAFFAGNMLGNIISNTGAFEIFVGNKRIWSAIENQGKIPQIESIEAMIRKYGGVKLIR